MSRLAWVALLLVATCVGCCSWCERRCNRWCNNQCGPPPCNPAPCSCNAPPAANVGQPMVCYPAGSTVQSSGWNNPQCTCK